MRPIPVPHTHPPIPQPSRGSDLSCLEILISCLTLLGTDWNLVGRAPDRRTRRKATARLRVTGLTCRLAGPLPWTRARSCSAHSQRVDRLAHVCSLTEDVARVLQAAANDNSGLKSMGASWLLLSRCCPSHASLRLHNNLKSKIKFSIFLLYYFSIFLSFKNKFFNLAKKPVSN